MAFHHLAVATRDTKATHDFYTRAMGFELVKTVVTDSPEGGWSKHFFYETGGGELIAFWELHDDALPEDWSPALSTGLGLPVWANHIAFDAADLDALAGARERWLDCGYDVLEADHGFCRSIYTRDPNGILVEFCTTTRAFTDADRRDAQLRLADPNPPRDPPADTTFHKGRRG